MITATKTAISLLHSLPQTFVADNFQNATTC